MEKFDEYDIRKLKEARRIINEVFNYNYDYSPTRKYEDRLETIIKKLDYLIGDCDK